MMRVPITGTIDYSAATDRFSSFRIAAPISVCYQVTTRCNYSCPHCLSSSGHHGEWGLSFEKSIEVLRILCEAGVKRINMTGGEPLLRKDLAELCEFAVQNGAEVVVTSNGSFTSERINNALRQSVKFIQISLDGRKEVNDALRHPGSFDRAVRAVAAYRGAGLDVRLNCTLQRSNVEEIDYILELAPSIGVSSVYFILVCAQGRASAERGLFCLEDELETVVNAKLKRLAVDGMDIKVLDFKRYEKSCVLVSPWGDLVSQGWGVEDCVVAGNLFVDGLEKCWNRPMAFDHLLHLIKNVRHPLLYS